MKVLIRGSRHENKTAIVDCSNCGSKLEVSENDGSRVSDQRDGDYRMFNCPVCQKLLTCGGKLFKNREDELERLSRVPGGLGT